MKYLFAVLASRRQFLLYCVFGGSGVMLDFLVYLVLVRMADTHVQLANAAGYACGTVLSFALNARLNFRTRDRLSLRFLAFCGTAALGWAASSIILHFLIAGLDLDKLLAKAVVIVVVVLLQYNLNRLGSFRKSTRADHA